MTTTTNPSFTGDFFLGCRNIYHANKTLLYDPLKSRQSSEGPWLSAFWDIFQNWLKQSARFYIECARLFPTVYRDIHEEARQNAKFSRFLDQGSEHRLSDGLSWDSHFKSLMTRIPRYVLLLNIVLKCSDKSDTMHKYSELEQLIQDLWEFGTIYGVKFEVDKYRLWLGDAGQRILPQDLEIQFARLMLYRESQHQDMVDVEILVIRKPDRFVAVLKRTQADPYSPRKVLAEVSVPGPPHNMLYLNKPVASGQHSYLHFSQAGQRETTV